MYKLMMVISFAIRQCCLPNPFENVSGGFVLNMVIEPLLYGMTYEIVGLFYKKGSMPALGSFLYLVFYCIHVGLLMLMVYFQWGWLAIMIISVIYIMLLVGVWRLFELFRDLVCHI